MGHFSLLAARVLVVVQTTQAAVVGTVRDAENGQPLAGAVVALTDLDRSAATDSAGLYVLPGVPAGPQHILVRLLGYAPRSLHALVPREGQLEINVSLRLEPIRLPAVEVRGPVAVRGLDRHDSSTFPDRESSIAAVRDHPLLAEPDVFQALGGGEAVQDPETPSGLSLRGGAPDQTAYLLDGIPVFSPYHAAGVSSAWNPDALSRLRLTSTTDPDALSGAIEAFTREPGDRLAAQGSVSTTQARLTVDGPLRVAGAGYLVSLRSGVHDVIAPKDATSYLGNGSGDWLAKVEAKAMGGSIRLLGYSSEDDLRFAARARIPQDSTGSARRNLFEWASDSFGVEWRRAGTRATTRVLGWSATGTAGSSWAAPTGPVDMAATRRDLGLLAGWEALGRRSRTVAELRLERTSTSYRVDSDSAAGPSWSIGARTPMATAVARHTISVHPRVELEAGAALGATPGAVRLGPSAGGRWNPWARLTLTARYARSHQFAQSLRNSESVIGNVFPVDVFVGSGAPGVPIARSDLGLIAADYRPLTGVRLGLQAYARESDGLLLVAPRDGGPFATGGFAIGSGSSRGMSVDFAVSSARFGLLASYGWQRVRLHYGDSSYVPDHGATHHLEGGVIVFPTPTASIRLGATAALGRRTTTIPGRFEWESCNLLDRGCEFAGSPDYTGEPLGATTLPAYVRVDLGARAHWHLAVGGRDEVVTVFGSVTNILGRSNLLTYARDPSTGERVGIGMRPASPLVVGLDWSF